MPHNCDFSTLHDIKEISINPKGWIENIVIEYGIKDQIGPTYFWRVKGTKHTFVIPISRLNFISSGDYSKHFSTVLENFREEDYLQWKATGFEAGWMQEYKSNYQKFIL
jgi:hypothetical protein